MLGATGGYVLSAVAWQVLPSVAPMSIPHLAAARADTTVFGFAVALAVINGILFGIVPALRLSRPVALSGLRARGPASLGRDRVRSSLVAAEVAFAVLLVITGGQVLASFVKW